MPIWVVVADATRARFFSADKPVSPLNEIQTLTNPTARLHNGELTSDRPGRDRNSPTNSGSHDMGHMNDAKQEEALRFAGQVCETLDSARSSGQFKKLYVIAAPGFLGLLRKGFSTSIRHLIISEIDKNITTQSSTDIRKQLPKFL